MYSGAIGHGANSEFTYKINVLSIHNLDCRNVLSEPLTAGSS